jgi:uncharacterized membrane protein
MDMNILLTASTLFFAVTVFVYLLICGRSDQTIADRPALSDEEMKPHFVLCAFYSNPDDPRGWVPKRWGYGWTVNFRKKRQIFIFCGLLALTLVSALAQSLFAVLMITTAG